jgi:hypothetical protein
MSQVSQESTSALGKLFQGLSVLQILAIAVTFVRNQLLQTKAAYQTED